MNAITPIAQVGILPREPFDRATEEFNAWRGCFLDRFTRSEAAITETLLILASVPERGAAVGLQQLVGQRLGTLAKVLAPGGPFAAEGKTAAEALTAFRTHDDLRTLLCHGVATIMLDRRGRWTALLRLVALKGGKAHRTSRTISAEETRTILDRLTATSHKLGVELGNVRARVGRSG